MDNIDVEYAREKGLHVINIALGPLQNWSSSFFWSSFCDSNRNMPLDGDSKFKVLKKAYAKGTELKGKTLGVIGFGRIGQATAKIGLGLGMKVIAHPFMQKATVTVPFFDGQSVNFNIDIESKDGLKEADFLSLHVPAQKSFVIGAAEIELMKEVLVL